jgi:hypothetical protein
MEASMPHLYGEPAFFSKAYSALRSSAYAYRGPALVMGGLDVDAALQNLLDAMRRAASSPAGERVRSRLSVHVESADLRAASVAIPADHWLRKHLRNCGFDLASPARH